MLITSSPKCCLTRLQCTCTVSSVKKKKSPLTLSWAEDLAFAAEKSTLPAMSFLQLKRINMWRVPSSLISTSWEQTSTVQTNFRISSSQLRDELTRECVCSYSRRVQRVSLQFPDAVKVLLWNLRLKLGRLGLRDLHAVQRANDLDVALCRGLERR